MAQSGTITRWNKPKGFGFIRSDKSGQDIFMHITAATERESVPKAGDKVVFSIGKDDNGRVRATSVVFPDKALSKNTAVKNKKKNVRKRSTRNRFLIATASVFLLGTITATYLNYLSPALTFLYCLMSLITFFIYRSDKQAARNDGWRTKEATLQSLSLFGGWPGALVGQQVFNHKSKKLKFQIVFYITVICNCAAFAWLFSEQGVSIMKWFDEMMIGTVNELLQRLE